MIRIELTQEEKDLLRQYFQTSPLKLIRLKAQAVLMRSKGLKYGDISDLLFKNERTVKRWIRDFSETRMASIFTGHQNNENASKLTREQRKEIKETLNKPPSECDIPKEFWSVPTLKEYVQAEFGIIYESERSYHFLLKFSDLSFKQPATFDIKRDEELIKKRMAEIVLETNKYLADNQWEVLASDETRIQLEAITRRAWLKKGEKTIIKTERSNEYQNYIGFLDQKTFKCHLYELKWQNQEEIIESIEKLLRLYPDKRICIVWDNAPFHKGKLIRETLKKGNLLERVHLINFPPYAPDVNPTEHIWDKAKKGVANIQLETFEKVKKAFRGFITTRKFRYQIAASEK